jgi:Holliday junction DNA helicase RuvA
MIDQLTGKILSSSDNYIVIDIGGLGIKVNIPKISSKDFKMNEVMSFSTYLHVREDALDLYGFENESDRSLFLMLISISGIGPKLGLTIISGIAPDKLKMKIISGDVKALTSIPGVGAKTAKRIIIELKDKFSKIDSDTLGFEDEIDSKIFKDVISALDGLGYKEKESKKALKQLGLDKSEISNHTIENLIRKVLKILNE